MTTCPSAQWGRPPGSCPVASAACFWRRGSPLRHWSPSPGWLGGSQSWSQGTRGNTASVAGPESDANYINPLITAPVSSLRLLCLSFTPIGLYCLLPLSLFWGFMSFSVVFRSQKPLWMYAKSEPVEKSNWPDTVTIGLTSTLSTYLSHLDDTPRPTVRAGHHLHSAVASSFIQLL